ncbi:MAG: putative resolvase [Acidimicrobiales bacterium]|nr:putative resolvase [Acidimicrobiales bacterium]
MPRKRPQSAGPDTVVAYLRVSTAEQADSGLGLDSQRAAIEAECQRRGWTLVGVHVDAGASGKSLRNRDGLADGLAEVRSGRAGTLMVSKLDRLSRSLLDFASLMSDAQANGWNLVALDLGIDLSTPAGEFMASVMASAAQWERRIIGQRTRDALVIKRAQGVKLGRPRQLPDETANRILAEHDAGNGWSSIARRLNAESVPTAHGGREWYPATVRNVWTSRVPPT